MRQSLPLKQFEQTAAKISSPLSTKAWAMTSAPEDPLFDPDWHHTDDATELLYLVGMFSLEWNMVEHYMSAVIWNFVGGHEVGMTITNHMGNRSKSEVLLELLEKNKTDERVKQFARSASDSFERLRGNRNILIHSHSILPASGENFEFRRSHPKSPMGHSGVITTKKELYENISACMVLGKNLISLIIATRPSYQGAIDDAQLPSDFPMPKKFQQLPFESLPT